MVRVLINILVDEIIGRKTFFTTTEEGGVVCMTWNDQSGN